MRTVVFTGTRQGMTKAQATTLFGLLYERHDKSTLFLHGGCEGADWQFHNLILVHARALDIKATATVWSIDVHPSDIYDSYPPFVKRWIGWEQPPTDEDLQGAWLREGANGCTKRYPPLDRNSHMISRAISTTPFDAELIATPKEAEEQIRSGTWSTVRRARGTKLPIRVILPDGVVA